MLHISHIQYYHKTRLVVCKINHFLTISQFSNVQRHTVRPDLSFVVFHLDLGLLLPLERKT